MEGGSALQAPLLELAVQMANNSAPALWPLAEFGPNPGAPPCLTDIVRPLGAGANGTRNLTVCGNNCSEVSGCTVSLNSVDNFVCDCVFPNSEDAQALGLDLVFPPSINVALDRVNFCLVSSLIGKDEKASRYADEQGLPYRCRCNI